MYVHNWITLLCTWNTVSQLYVNKIYILKKKNPTHGSRSRSTLSPHFLTSWLDSWVPGRAAVTPPHTRPLWDPADIPPSCCGCPQASCWDTSISLSTQRKRKRSGLLGLPGHTPPFSSWSFSLTCLRTGSPECNLMKPLWRTVWMVLKKLKRVAICASNPTPGHRSRQNYNSRGHMHPSVHSSTIYNSHDMRQPKCPLTMNGKEDVVHTYSGILLNPKEEWNNAMCRNTDEPRDYQTKWSQTEKDNHISLMDRI